MRMRCMSFVDHQIRSDQITLHLFQPHQADQMSSLSSCHKNARCWDVDPPDLPLVLVTPEEVCSLAAWQHRACSPHLYTEYLTSIE